MIQAQKWSLSAEFSLRAPELNETRGTGRIFHGTIYCRAYIKEQIQLFVKKYVSRQRTIHLCESFKKDVTPVKYRQWLKQLRKKDNPLSLVHKYGCRMSKSKISVPSSNQQLLEKICGALLGWWEESWKSINRAYDDTVFWHQAEIEILNGKHVELPIGVKESKLSAKEIALIAHCQYISKVQDNTNPFEMYRMITKARVAKVWGDDVAWVFTRCLRALFAVSDYGVSVQKELLEEAVMCRIVGGKYKYHEGHVFYRTVEDGLHTCGVIVQLEDGDIFEEISLEYLRLKKIRSGIA